MCTRGVGLLAMRAGDVVAAAPSGGAADADATAAIAKANRNYVLASETAAAIAIFQMLRKVGLMI